MKIIKRKQTNLRGAKSNDAGSPFGPSSNNGNFGSASFDLPLSLRSCIRFTRSEDAFPFVGKILLLLGMNYV